MTASHSERRLTPPEPQRLPGRALHEPIFPHAPFTGRRRAAKAEPNQGMAAGQRIEPFEVPWELAAPATYGDNVYP
jgi:hypothetical protein